MLKYNVKLGYLCCLESFEPENPDVIYKYSHNIYTAAMHSGLFCGFTRWKIY